MQEPTTQTVSISSVSDTLTEIPSTSSPADACHGD